VLAGDQSARRGAPAVASELDWHIGETLTLFLTVTARGVGSGKVAPSQNCVRTA
jgi:hypothetical protein